MQTKYKKKITVNQTDSRSLWTKEAKFTVTHKNSKLLNKHMKHTIITKKKEKTLTMTEGRLVLYMH